MALNEEEREWVHTAAKYIPSKRLPQLGRLLKTFDDASMIVGRGVLIMVLLGGILGAIAVFGPKILEKFVK